MTEEQEVLETRRIARFLPHILGGYGYRTAAECLSIAWLAVRASVKETGAVHPGRVRSRVLDIMRQENKRRAHQRLRYEEAGQSLREVPAQDEYRTPLEQWTELRDRRKGLDERTRLILYLFCVEGLTAHEIAATMQVGANRIWAVIKAARVKMGTGVVKTRSPSEKDLADFRRQLPVVADVSHDW